VLLNKNSLEMIWEFAVLLLFVIICMIDLSGYWLVRKLILNSASNNNMLRHSTNPQHIRRKLTKIRRFHIFISTSLITYIATYGYWLSVANAHGWDASESWDLRPNEYFPDVQSYAFLVILGVFYWWALISQSTRASVVEEDNDVALCPVLCCCCCCCELDDAATVTYQYQGGGTVYGIKVPFNPKQQGKGYDAVAPATTEPSTAIKLESTHEWQGSADQGFVVDENGGDEEGDWYRTHSFTLHGPYGPNQEPPKS